MMCRRPPRAHPRRPGFPVVSPFTLLALLAMDASAAPITFNTALPVAKGSFVGRMQAVHSQSGGDSGPRRRKAEGNALISVLGYGVSPKLAVFGVLPLVDKRLEVDGGNGRYTRAADGLGDARLFGRYTVVQRDGQGYTLRLAPFVGLELPTGANHRGDGQGTLPPGVQPGSGALDLFGGLIATWQTLDYQIDGQIGYQFNRQADGFDPGDVLRADLSAQYRLWPRQLGGGVPGFLYGVIESNWIHTGKDQRGGRSDTDSGGTTVFLSPGLQYVTRRWIVEAAVSVPVGKHLNGNALEPGNIVRAGFRVNF